MRLPDRFAKGASGRLSALDKLCFPSCDLHVLHVVLTSGQPTPPHVAAHTSPCTGVGGGGMVHVHMLCVYVGKTHLACVRRLRKHGTTAAVGAEDCRFHAMLRQTGLHEWTPIPLQYVFDDVEGCFVERDWWFRLKRWALDDNAPAVPTFVHQGPPSAQKSKRLRQLLEQIWVAQQDGDFARKRAISNKLNTVATDLDIPLV